MRLLTRKNLETRLKEAAATGLPGLEAHKRMAPPTRLDDRYKPEPQNAGKSAVMILIFEENNELYIPFIERPHDGSIHGGQIALPGGKSEPQDTDRIETAIRETEEEIGVLVGRKQIISELSPLYIPVSNYTVKPIVAYADARPKFKTNPSEVADLHIIHLNKLLHSPIVNKTLRFGNQDVEIPFFIQNSTQIWGATAMIMNELKEILTKKRLS